MFLDTKHEKIKFRKKRGSLMSPPKNSRKIPPPRKLKAINRKRKNQVVSDENNNPAHAAFTLGKYVINLDDIFSTDDKIITSILM